MLKLRKIYFILLLPLLLGIVIIISPTSPPTEVWKIVDERISKYKSEFDNPKYAIYIDYNRMLYKKRLWVLDLESKKILMNTHVSHAWNSGFLKPNKFSNEVGSKISCKGTFRTLNSYESQFGKGKYKIGMRVKGLEMGQNSNAFKRYIVFHSNYSPWSAGCFMTLPWINKEIITLTKNGSILIVD